MKRWAIKHWAINHRVMIVAVSLFGTALPLCLTCHGAALSPDVEAALAESYPEDHATGYSAGDLRGAFVVERVIAPV